MTFAQGAPDSVGVGSPLFRSMTIGGLALHNRIVALPLYTGYAHPGGRVSPLLVEHYWRLARSGAGLVVVENAAVSFDGATSPATIRADGDEFIPGLSQLARAIHSQGAVACLQLNHAGRYAWTERPLLPAPMSAGNLAFDIAALKAFMESFPFERRFGLTRMVMARAVAWQRGMTDAERERVVRDFGLAAARAAEAGFDMVELHGATGYLISQFLSQYTNPPGTAFGGDLRSRARFILDVLREVRHCLPGGFPVGYRLMLREWTPGGIELDEALALASMLEEEGVAYLSATAGTYTSFFLPEVRALTARPGHLAEDTAALKRRTGVPVIAAGKIIAPVLAERLLRAEAADLVGLARPLLADRDWVRKARDGGKVRPCLDCFHCLKQVVRNEGVSCVRWPEIETGRLRLELAMLKRRAFHDLVVAASIEDLHALRRFWQARIPAREDVSATICLVRNGSNGETWQAEVESFLGWSKEMWLQRGCRGVLDHVVVEADDAPDQAVLREAHRRGCGVVIMPRMPWKPWKERVATRFRGGVLSLMGTHAHQHRILVPVDLSDTTALALRYISHAHHGKPELSFGFLHVQEDVRDQPMRRWREALRTLGWDEGTPLEVVQGQGVPGEAILRHARTGGHGQVIMGRRGMSGLKRLFLGSVSSAVLRGLKDQSLTLVS